MGCRGEVRDPSGMRIRKSMRNQRGEVNAIQRRWRIERHSRRGRRHDLGVNVVVVVVVRRGRHVHPRFPRRSKGGKNKAVMESKREW